MYVYIDTNHGKNTGSGVLVISATAFVGWALGERQGMCGAATILLYNLPLAVAVLRWVGGGV